MVFKEKSYCRYFYVYFSLAYLTGAFIGGLHSTSYAINISNELFGMGPPIAPMKV